MQSVKAENDWTCKINAFNLPRGYILGTGVVRQFGKILKRKKAQNFQKKHFFGKIKHFLEQNICQFYIYYSKIYSELA